MYGLLDIEIKSFLFLEADVIKPFGVVYLYFCRQLHGVYLG
jgi:hypothetical protein